MKILVTGSAGFLGFALASELSRNQANRVFCVDNFSRGVQDEAYEALCKQSNVEHFTLDLSDAGMVVELPKSVDIIYHMAALNGTQNFYEKPLAVLKHTALPTLNLIDYYAGQNPGRFIYAGSSEVYASSINRGFAKIPTGEDVLLSIDDIKNPRWSYAASKIFCESAVVNSNIPWSIIRYHNVYGPRMGDKHVIPDFLARLRDGKPSLYGYEDTRSFIYVADAVRATIEIGNRGDRAGEIIHVGSDREIKIADLAAMLMDICGRTDEIELHPSPVGSVSRRCPDLSKLRRVTQFTEEWDLIDGLRETVKYYMQ